MGWNMSIDPRQVRSAHGCFESGFDGSRNRAAISQDRPITVRVPSIEEVIRRLQVGHRGETPRTIDASGSSNKTGSSNKVEST